MDVGDDVPLGREDQSHSGSIAAEFYSFIAASTPTCLQGSVIMWAQNFGKKKKAEKNL